MNNNNTEEKAQPSFDDFIAKCKDDKALNLALLEACRANDSEKINKILIDNPDAKFYWDCIDDYDDKDCDGIKLLLEHKIPIRGIELHFACDQGTLKIIELLLPHMIKETFNYINPYTGFTALHFACYKYNERTKEFAKAVLPYLTKDTINHQNLAGATALHFACMNGDIDNTELLLKHMDIKAINTTNKILELPEGIFMGPNTAAWYSYMSQMNSTDTSLLSSHYLRRGDKGMWTIRDGHTALEIAHNLGHVKIVYLIAEKLKEGMNEKTEELIMIRKSNKIIKGKGK